MSKKSDMIGNLIHSATELAQVREHLRALKQAYMDWGYNTGGSNPITDADAAPFDITATQAENYVNTFATKFNSLMSNANVTAIDGDGIVNAIRNDL